MVYISHSAPHTSLRLPHTPHSTFRISYLAPPTAHSTFYISFLLPHTPLFTAHVSWHTTSHFILYTILLSSRENATKMQTGTLFHERPDFICSIDENSCPLQLCCGSAGCWISVCKFSIFWGNVKWCIVMWQVWSVMHKVWGMRCDLWSMEYEV